MSRVLGFGVWGLAFQTLGLQVRVLLVFFACFSSSYFAFVCTKGLITTREDRVTFCLPPCELREGERGRQLQGCYC